MSLPLRSIVGASARMRALLSPQATGAVLCPPRGSTFRSRPASAWSGIGAHYCSSSEQEKNPAGQCAWGMGRVQGRARRGWPLLMQAGVHHRSLRMGTSPEPQHCKVSGQGPLPQLPCSLF